MIEEPRNYKARAAILFILVGTLWLVHAIDAFLPRGISAAGHGIVPRTWDGLWSIPVAPLIHADWDHLIANTVPLVVLGALILLRGLYEFIFVTLCTVIVSGLGTWIFGTGNAQHIGASGVVFGYFGYLVFRSAFDRKLTSALITLVVGVAYGTAMVYSLVPSEEVSWSAHFFGFVGGFLAARVRYPHQRPSPGLRPPSPRSRGARGLTS
jgi:membrane associated rhomboid family serine protease